MTRILITGCRRWQPRDLITGVVLRLQLRYDSPIIIHGCATGIDSTFADVCDSLDVETEEHPADWSIGNRAGPERNARMISRGADLCLAFHRQLKWSKGTGGCVKLALAASIPVWWFRDETGEMVRIKTWEDVGQ